MASGSVKKKTLGITPSTDVADYNNKHTISDLNFTGRIMVTARNTESDYNWTKYFSPSNGTHVLTYFGAEAGSSKTGYGKLIKLNFLNMMANFGENYVGLRTESTITSNVNTGNTICYFIDSSFIPTKLIDKEME